MKRIADISVVASMSISGKAPEIKISRGKSDVTANRSHRIFLFWFKGLKVGRADCPRYDFMKCQAFLSVVNHV